MEQNSDYRPYWPPKNLDQNEGIPEGKVDVTDYALELLDGMGEDRYAILVARTLRRLGVDSADQANEDCFHQAMTEELKIMMVNDTMQRLLELGLVEVVGVDDTGARQYAATEKGRQAAEGNN